MAEERKRDEEKPAQKSAASPEEAELEGMVAHFETLRKRMNIPRFVPPSEATKE